MKKWIMYFAGVLLIGSMAACTPTDTRKQNMETSSMSADEMPTAGGAWDKVPDPTAESVDVVAVYVEDSSGKALDKKMSEVKELDAQALVDKLIEFEVLEEGTKVLSFEVSGESAAEAGGPGADKTETSAAAEKIGTLDISGLPQWKDDEAKVGLGALGNTFIENFDLDKLKLLVDGKEYDAAGEYLEYFSMKK